MRKPGLHRQSVLRSPPRLPSGLAGQAFSIAGIIPVKLESTSKGHHESLEGYVPHPALAGSGPKPPVDRPVAVEKKNSQRQIPVEWESAEIHSRGIGDSHENKLTEESTQFRINRTDNLPVQITAAHSGNAPEHHKQGLSGSPGLLESGFNTGKPTGLQAAWIRLRPGGVERKKSKGGKQRVFQEGQVDFADHGPGLLSIFPALHLGQDLLYNIRKTDAEKKIMEDPKEFVAGEVGPDLLTIPITLAALAMFIAPGPAQVVDDFSGGDWTLFSSTPGEISAGPGKLHLRDAPGPPDWVTASKTFTIDIDRTPLFVVNVLAASDHGTVKLIRKEPHDKRVAVEIDRPGLFVVNLRDRFGWQGTARIETCLYAIGEEEEITFEYIKYAGELTEKEKELIGNQAAGGNVRLMVSPFEVVPLFSTCSYYFKSPGRPGLAVAHRGKGGTWLGAFPPVYVKEDGMYRGSIVDLDEDTPYELKITAANGDVLAQQTFRTWRSQVPTGKTIILDETTFPGQLTIRESGSPGGWIRITGKKGFVLRNDRTGPLIELVRAKYIILEGLMLRGGLKEAISIRRCRHIRVVNCDIAGWGRIGTQRFDLDGKYYTREGRAINWDSAILISKSTGTVVERCYIHDPVSTANSWYESHPAGPQAVGMDKSPSTVLRYNDFIGSDEHRWNDAVEGAGNFHLNGGFNRDGDIYGNLMCFANDDALEIDGGQTNVRVFLNKFEGCLCGVSIQGCMSGPSYVFRNLLVNMGDERGLAGQTIKTSSYANGPGAVSFIFGNTCHGRSRDLNLPHNLRIVARNNIFAGRSAISGMRRSPQSECDYNLLSTGDAADEEHGIPGKPDFIDAGRGNFALRKTSKGVGRGIAIENFAPGKNGRTDMGAIPLGSGLVLPLRPIPVDLDCHQMLFSPSDVRSGRSRSVTATVGGEGFSGRYRIARNEAFDWFHVTPEAGVLESGKTETFVVMPRPGRMTGRPLYRGAFLIRLDSGYSRPVLVYARTDFVPAMKPEREGSWVAYAEAEAPVAGKARDTIADPLASGGKCILLAGSAGKDAVEYRFRVPLAGHYFVLLRVKSDEPVESHDSLLFSVDGGPLERARLRSAGSWTWSLAAHNREMSLICLQPFKLTAGEHVLKLAPRASIYVDLVAITDDPKLFD